MLTLVPYLILSLVGVMFCGMIFWKAFDIPRNVILSVGGLVSLWLWIGYGASVIYLPSGVVYLTLGMLVWWLARSMTSAHPQNSLNDCVVFGGVVVMCLLLEPGWEKVAIQVFVVAALLNCVYAIMQRDFRYEPLKESSNFSHHYAIGFLGNENMLGCYLVPHIFMAGWLGATVHPAWFMAVIPIIYTTWRTRCKNAFLGVASGLVYLTGIYVGWMMTVNAAIVAGLIIGVLYYKGVLKDRNGLNTLRERLNYWRVALLQIQKTPLMGLGFNEFQIKVPFLQRELNKDSNGEFLKKENYECPYPQKCHNDYLQHALDNGLIGLGLILALTVLALRGHVGMTGNWSFLTAGFVTMLVMSAFFHTFHIRSTNVLFWFLTFMLIRAGSSELMPVELGIPLVIFILVIYGVLVIRAPLRWALADFWYHRFVTKGDIKYAKKCLNIRPYSGAFRTMVSKYYFQKNQVPQLYEHSMAAVHDYDGDQRLWELWANLGTALMLNGAFHIAKRCYETSLSFLPYYDRALTDIAQIDNILNQVNNKQTVRVVDEQSGEMGKIGGYGRDESAQMAGLLHTPPEPV